MEDPQAPLVSQVFLNTDPQREELWTSANGIDWDRISELSTYPDKDRNAWALPSGGFLARTGDYTVETSPNGVDWTPIEGVNGVGTAIEESGGELPVTVATRGASFISELPTEGERILWVFEVRER